MGSQKVSKRVAHQKPKAEDKDDKPQEVHQDGHHPNLSERIKHFIGSHLHAPSFVKDNMYIHSGYRINFESLRSITKSLFMVHNEMVNIWSHFLGAVLVIILSISLMTSFGNIDLESWKQKLVGNVQDKLQPIYNELKYLDEVLNMKVSQGVQIIKEDYNILEDKVVDNFNNFFNELNQLRTEVTPDNINVDELVEKFKQFSFQEYYDKLDLHTITAYKEKVLSNLNEMKNELVAQIDSKEFDWLDFHISDFMHSNDNQTQSLNTNNVSRMPIFIFLVSATLCLLCSAAFHLFYPVNQRLYKIFLRLDYAGVSLLISGSTAPIFYYGFFCAPHIAYTYLISISVASLIVFFVSLQDFIHTQEYFTMKSVMYGGLGVFAAIPSFHLLYEELFDNSLIGSFSMSNSLFYYLLMGICYLGGLTIYATRCPERYYPGHFDICGASHQLWHISILLAIVFTYIAALINFYTRKMSTCPVS